ncbi:Predicted N-acetyltransferase YhbS [Rhodospirillales bacterium URHD0017]|nr:Predicted N-acetyltransferase YhbS [Rhodospirillales bacterium URHD0017]
MIVRDARPADASVVHRLIGQLADSVDEAAFRTRFERVLATDDHRVIVADVEGKVVGVLHMFERPALEKPCEAVVQALVVDSEARSSGVGEALMREAEAWAQGRRLPSVSLYSRADRKRAHAFYEHIGYRVKATSVRMERGL